MCIPNAYLPPQAIMCITKLFMSNAGEDVAHAGNHGTENTEDYKQKTVMRSHLKNLLYAEMSLLSSIISSIGVLDGLSTTLVVGWPFVCLFACIFV